MNNKIKPINELKFESEGEELLYFFDKVENLNPDYLTNLKEKGANVSLEKLREEYSRLYNSSQNKEKYEKSSVYWTIEQERAIVSYCNETDLELRNKIFREKLYKSFKKLVENIIFTYKLFRKGVEIRELQEDCVSFLITKLDRYEPSQGTMAYSFFGTIAKHYLMGEKKNSNKNSQTNIDIEESNAEQTLDNDEEEKEMDLKQENINIHVFNETIKILEEKLESDKVLPNDKKVMEAIVFLFKKHEVINIYNRNLLHHLIKERTDLKPKDITYSLTRIKKNYKIFKQDIIKEMD
jgi:hypothetical protein